MRIRQVSITLTSLSLLVAGCGSTAGTDAGAEIELSALPKLVGRFAEESMIEPIVAVEAFIGDQAFFVSYQSVDGLVYAGGNWSNRIDLAPILERQSDTYAGPYILPLEYQQSEPWLTRPEKQITPRQLSREQWDTFRERFFESVLPKTGKVGIALHFDVDDYFLFYNELGRFEARVLQDKPADYSVFESLRFDEFIRRGMPLLVDFLAEEGISERRVVFNTGDAGAYSLPFFYIDLDLPIAVFVRYPTAPTDGGTANPTTQFSQSVGHVAQSHTGSMIVRPVSSLYRLFFFATDAAVETVQSDSLRRLKATSIPDISKGAGMDLVAWEGRLDKLTGRTASTGNIDYLIDGEEYFTRFVDAITSARQSIHIRTYIFDNDDYAKKIGGLLKRRSNEGLDVKLLLDGLGTIVSTRTDDETMPEDHEAPASVRVFLESDSNVDVRQARNPWLAGDHVKTTIIDDTIAFTGGMNIGREYRYVWHDLMMEVSGPVVDILSREFHDAWAHAGPLGDVGYLFHKMKLNRQTGEGVGYPVRVLFTRTGNSEIFRVQREAIRNAQGYVYVQNAYFTDDAMLFELAKARRRGVDVRVILPLFGNHGPINQSNVLAANAMLEHGIRVYIYPGMSHVKAAVFDGWACLGSANWDKLSFRINKELNLATSHPAAVDELNKRLFEADFARSVELTEQFPERWSDHLTEVVADYLL
jgi:cardiolipin synthase